MASLRDIRTRITSVKNTRQITNAMKLVSAAKMRRATEAATSAKPYKEALGATLSRVAAGVGETDEVLLTQRAEVKKILVVLVGSDRGLCGGFNNTLGRRTVDFLQKKREEGVEVTVWTYGKKLRDFCKARGVAVGNATIGINPPKFLAEVQELGAKMVDGFANGEFDEVYLAANVFKSAMTQIPTFSKVVPIAIEAAEQDVATIEYKTEPTSREILAALLPLYLRTTVLQAFLETEAGEHASRMTAMDNATRNANDLIRSLTLDYNRGRQAAITRELIEIISGAEAL